MPKHGQGCPRPDLRAVCDCWLLHWFKLVVPTLTLYLVATLSPNFVKIGWVVLLNPAANIKTNKQNKTNKLTPMTHAGSMPSINGVSVCFSASSGITSSPTMKFDVRPTNLYSRKLSRHGVWPCSGISPEWTTM